MDFVIELVYNEIRVIGNCFIPLEKSDLVIIKVFKVLSVLMANFLRVGSLHFLFLTPDALFGVKIRSYTVFND
jgi:hypothetical protein